jgi:hypothetical protein
MVCGFVTVKQSDVLLQDTLGPNERNFPSVVARGQTVDSRHEAEMGCCRRLNAITREKEAACSVSDFLD